jgi:hypothetical protein
MRSCTETEMAFMGILKIIQHQVFLRKLPGQSSRKVSSLFRHDPGLCGFSTPTSAAASLESSAARGQHVGVASPESRRLVSGGVSQLSVERWADRRQGCQAGRHYIADNPAQEVKL